MLSLKNYEFEVEGLHVLENNSFGGANSFDDVGFDGFSDACVMFLKMLFFLVHRLGTLELISKEILMLNEG